MAMDHSASVSARKLLWLGTAGLWTLAALLKLQPQMFSANLFINVLAPTAADSQPAWLAALLSWTGDIWVHHMAIANFSVFLIEAAIAVLLWMGPDRRGGRTGLWILIVWSLIVWVAGEGLGSLLSGDASFMSEAPGSAPLYGVAAAMLLLPRAFWIDGKATRWLRIGLGVFWACGTAMQLQPDFFTGAGLAGVFGNVTMNGTQPPYMALLINMMVTTTYLHAIGWNLVFVLAMALLAAGFLLKAPARVMLWLSLSWLLFLWIFPQAFGSLWTGTGTDPGSAVPVVLLTLTALSTKALRPARLERRLRTVSGTAP
jgi:hypothetical protein